MSLSLRPLSALLCALAFASSVSGQLSNYWPVTEAAGATTANTAGGTPGTLNLGAAFATDPGRGQVLQFDGTDAYVDAGSLPVMTTVNDFTWSFWSNNQQSISSNVVLGNRYSSTTNVDFAPREFTKFTNSQFEYHRNGSGENIDYANMPMNTWDHHAVVKTGNHFASYRNGLLTGISFITLPQNNPQPLFFGGNGTFENWQGQLDDIATWTSPLPYSSVLGLARGTFNPNSAPLSAPPPPTLTPVAMSDFSNGLLGWVTTVRGLENTSPAGYNPPSAPGGVATLGGTTTLSYWYGSSIETLETYSSTVETMIEVDRVSLTGSGTAFRSSLWILADDFHYLHFAQDRFENGWQWNSRDEGGVGSYLPTGAGNNIPELDPLDADGGLHRMGVRLVPTGTPGEVNMYMYLDGNLVAGVGFSQFPEEYRVVLTGQARAENDSVTAEFDNFVLQQVPEPSLATLVALGAGLAVRRRRSA